MSRETTLRGRTRTSQNITPVRSKSGLIAGFWLTLLAPLSEAKADFDSRLKGVQKP